MYRTYKVCHDYRFPSSGEVSISVKFTSDESSEELLIPDGNIKLGGVLLEPGNESGTEGVYSASLDDEAIREHLGQYILQGVRFNVVWTRGDGSVVEDTLEIPESPVSDTFYGSNLVHVFKKDGDIEFGYWDKLPELSPNETLSAVFEGKTVDGDKKTVRFLPQQGTSFVITEEDLKGSSFFVAADGKYTVDLVWLERQGTTSIQGSNALDLGATVNMTSAGMASHGAIKVF